MLAFVVASVCAGADGGLLGDRSDGSRAHPTHEIALYYTNEDGEKSEEKIAPDDDPAMPFSTKQTCGECHSYNVINKGLHFNYVDPNVDPGRPGQPWVLADARTGTQIPLSYRDWEGTFNPSQVGLSTREFTTRFGRHFPGGGAGEVSGDKPDDVMREFVSGKLEINCLACHNGHHNQNQGGPGGYAVQVVRENFRWAATASSEFARVKGSAKDMPSTYDMFFPEAPTGKTPPTVDYRPAAFNSDLEVAFHIEREAPSHRCYYCHSNVFYTDEHTEKWTTDEDIHMTSGLKCVDCHRNGIEHNLIRGYPGEPSDPNVHIAARSSCEGCHLEEHVGETADAGRLSAPVPEHIGLPTVHFEKLACTACHSGPWPGEKTVWSKTSRAHRLGTPNVNKAPEVLPHIVSPVLAKQADGKLAPHKMVWPAYWCTIDDQNVAPVDFDTVKSVVGALREDANMPASGDWPELTGDDVKAGLAALAVKLGEGSAVGYVTGGSLYHLDESGEMVEQADHPAGEPYLWPIGHNVRPAAQSLGIRYCTDCHATDSPFFFGDVMVDSTLAGERERVKEMVEFQGVNRTYAWAFAASFVFRPFFKIVGLGSCALLGVVLLLYGLKALGCVVRVLTNRDQK